MADTPIRIKIPDLHGQTVTGLAVLVTAPNAGAVVNGGGDLLVQSVPGGMMCEAVISEALVGKFDYLVTRNGNPAYYGTIDLVDTTDVQFADADLVDRIERDGGMLDAVRSVVANQASNANDVANLVLAGLGGVTVSIVSPYDPKTKLLTLVQRADYKTGAVSPPLRFKISAAGVSVGDNVRFGAKKRNQTPIVKSGVVVEINGDSYAEIELDHIADTDRKAGKDWRWELEHIDVDGNISPLIVDQKMILLPQSS